MCLRFAHLFPVLIFPHSYLINSQVNNDFFIEHLLQAYSHKAPYKKHI